MKGLVASGTSPNDGFLFIRLNKKREKIVIKKKDLIV